MRVILFITLSILIFQFYPVTALMIVLLAILNDIPIMTIAYDNVKISNSPETWDMRRVLIVATFLGVIGVISSFLILYIGLYIIHLSLMVSAVLHISEIVGIRAPHCFHRQDRGSLLVRPSRKDIGHSGGRHPDSCYLDDGLRFHPPIHGVGIGRVDLGLWRRFLLVTDTLKVYLYRYLDRKNDRKGTSPSKNTSEKTIS